MGKSSWADAQRLMTAFSISRGDIGRADAS
jgi:hypothetical protein